MTLLDVAGLREHFTTRYGDGPLQTWLDAAESDINARWGPLERNMVEQIRPHSATPWISLRRWAAEIVSVVERNGDTDYTLDPTDYLLFSDGFTLERQRAGAARPSSSWGRAVTVTYRLVNDADSRIRVQVALVKLDARYDGRVGHSTGDESESLPIEYATERREIIDSLHRTLLRVG